MNFEFARKELTKELSQKGIKDPRVLEAIYQIPRHEFVDATFTSRAYQDMSLPIGHQQTISQPFVVAKMTELLIQGNVLDQKPLGAVLEIGTGCGYQTAILARFCRKVFSLERIEALSLRADNNLKKVGVDNYQLRWSDGTLGWPTPKKLMPSITKKCLNWQAVAPRLCRPGPWNSLKNTTSHLKYAQPFQPNPELP